MSAAPVKLDMSTAQPLSQAAVTLDMSTVQPLAGTKSPRSLLQLLRDNIHTAATEPIDDTLDSYSHATEFGAKHVRQGVAQAIEGTAHMFRHPIDAAQEMGLIPTSGDPREQAADVARRAIALKDAVPKDALDLAGKSGNLGGQLLTNVAMGETAGAGVRVAGKSAAVISDVAKSASDRATLLAQKAARITPKQAAQGAGAVGGVVAGHGPLSIPAAEWGAYRAGKIAEVLLGKDRANSPIFKGNADLPLDDMADALAQTIADDRARVEINKSKGLGELPATGAKPASQTGEALANEPTRGPEPTGGKSASAPRFTQADRAAAKSLLQDALKQHSGDIIDAAIPPSGTTRGANLFTRTQVDAALKSGDVGQAEKVLDAAAKATNPSWTPLQRQIVPSVNEIRARVKAETPGSPQDILETRGIQESMREDLQKHGWAAESEARREFIARNSTGMTKGELGRRFAATSGKASPAAVPASDDLTDVLQKSLDAVRARSEQK